MLQQPLLGVLTAFMCLGMQLSPASSTTTSAFLASDLHKKTASCPGELQLLAEKLLQDLPKYANRVIQRARKLDRDVDIFSYIVIAGKPEFEPLELENSEYQVLFPDLSQQVFFTTLERRYLKNEVIEWQNYHWLFLTQTGQDWYMVMLFSRFGTIDPERPPSPPMNNTNGAIGEAVRLWLRDCRAATVKK